MPVYELGDEPLFPDPEDSDPSGLLAVGGDLSPRRLLRAYACGIFPWYSEGGPILWHSPDPRALLLPAELHVPRSLRRTLRCVATSHHSCGNSIIIMRMSVLCVYVHISTK